MGATERKPDSANHDPATPSRPLILAVDEAPMPRSRRGQLSRRYGEDYDVRAVRSAAEALAVLRERGIGEPVALVLADQWLQGTTGAELLERSKPLHPAAKRGLLIASGGWGDAATAEAIFEAMASAASTTTC